MKKIVLVLVLAVVVASPALAFDYSKCDSRTNEQAWKYQDECAAQRHIDEVNKNPSLAIAGNGLFQLSPELAALEFDGGRPQSYWDGEKWNKYRYYMDKLNAADVYKDVVGRKIAMGIRSMGGGYDIESKAGAQAFTQLMMSNGGTYHPINGYGTFIDRGNTYMFNNNVVTWVEIPERGYLKTIDFQNDIMTYESAVGRLRVNLTTNEFVDAQMSMMDQASQQLLSSVDKDMGTNNNATLVLLNDVYAVIEEQKGVPGTQSWPLDEFVGGLFQRSEMRDRTFAMAAKIYNAPQKGN